MFALSLNVKHFYLTHWQDPIRCCHSRSVWNRGWWQWRAILNSPKFQTYWNLTIRLLSIISRTLFGRVLLLCRDAVNVVCCPGRRSHKTLVARVLLLCRDAVSVVCSSGRISLKTLVARVLPLCRDVVGVVCSPSWRGQGVNDPLENVKIIRILPYSQMLQAHFKNCSRK